MCRSRTDPNRATALEPSRSLAHRRRRGRTNWQSGAAAEELAARHYEARGATVLERRLRTPEGELDLVIEHQGILVFVEVKRRAAALLDSPVTERQWRRLANAALHYMIRAQKETGVQPVCRFDVALAGPDGRLRIIENARSFD
jgi:putative endonuclease